MGAHKIAVRAFLSQNLREQVRYHCSSIAREKQARSLLSSSDLRKHLAAAVYTNQKISEKLAWLHTVNVDQDVSQLFVRCLYQIAVRVSYFEVAKSRFKRFMQKESIASSSRRPALLLPWLLSERTDIDIVSLPASSKIHLYAVLATNLLLVRRAKRSTDLT